MVADIETQDAAQSQGAEGELMDEQLGATLREWWRPLLIFLASRLAVLSMVGAAGVALRRPVSTILVGWDAKWYLMIASKGYVHHIPHLGTEARNQSDLGFFPLLPLIIRCVHLVSGLAWSTSGFLAVTFTGITASLALWCMLRDRFALDATARGIALILLSPCALAFSYVYSEGLILTGVALSLFLLGRKRWLLAGLAASLATAADPVGCAAFFPCAVAAYLAIRQDREWKALLAPFASLIGVTSFFGYLWIHAGSPFTWFDAQRAGWQGGIYGLGVPNAVWTVLAHGFHNVNPPVKVASFLIAIWLVVRFVKVAVPPTWRAYVYSVLAFGLLSPIIGITPRILLRDGPLLGTVGATLDRFRYTIVLSVSLVALCALTILASTPKWTP